MTAIPLIDLAPARKGNAADRLAVARDIGVACTEIGFFTISGHGVAETLVRDTQAAGRAFFDLPLAEKQKLRREPPAFNRGWGPLEGEALAKSLGNDTPPDLKESLSFGPMDVPDLPYFTDPAAFPHFVANRWPPQPAGMQALCTAYFRAMEDLSAELMRLFALSLDMPEEWFATKIDRSCASLRLIDYPPPLVEPAKDQLRAGAHTDYGSLTILKAEDVPGGLEARTREGEWIKVAPADDAFVINIGDLMMMWTNDRWVSTLHRVGNAPVGGKRRLSLVYFQFPNYDADIECIATCHGPDSPARYPPITAGAHRLMKLNRANAA
jgi:isopenicillin N synthase-like dioxygenase